MKNVLLIYCFFVFISCKDKYENDINNSLNIELLKYQKKNHIPKNVHSSISRYFIYEVSFYKKKDTFMTIQLNTFGIRDNNAFGIYETKILKPTFIVDSNKYGQRFIKNYKNDNLKKYVPKITPPIIDIIYPVYKYKINGENLILIDSLRWK